MLKDEKPCTGRAFSIVERSPRAAECFLDFYKSHISAMGAKLYRVPELTEHKQKNVIKLHKELLQGICKQS